MNFVMDLQVLWQEGNACDYLLLKKDSYFKLLITLVS